MARRARTRRWNGGARKFCAASVGLGSRARGVGCDDGFGGATGSGSDVDARSACPDSSAAAASPSWEELAKGGKRREAYAVLGADGFARAVEASPPELLRLAEVARSAGRLAEAARAFDALRHKYRGDARAGLAAFELGRIRLDSMGNAAGAAEAFADAIALSPGAPFREDAEARRVQALERSGSGACAFGARRVSRAVSSRRARCDDADSMRAVTFGDRIFRAATFALAVIVSSTAHAEPCHPKGPWVVASVPDCTAAGVDAGAVLERLQAESEPANVPAASRAEAYVEEALSWLPQDSTTALSVSQHDVADPDVGGKTLHGRVLVADDNPDMRAYIGRLLGAHWDVDTVEDGNSAIEAIQKNPPDLVVTDAMMPGLDGFGLLAAIRNDPALRDLPVIMLSARAGEEARIEGLEAGADYYLTKPFSARELVAQVNANLTLARVRSEAARDLRAGEEALRRRTTQFETLLNEAPLGVYLVDADFKIRPSIPRHCRCSGIFPTSSDGISTRSFASCGSRTMPTKSYACSGIRSRRVSRT